MAIEPQTKRVRVFVDGQNLFHAVRGAFGYRYPNYDIKTLVEVVCRAKGWSVVGIHFYTGRPNEQDNPFWSHFWKAKLGAMGHQGIVVFSRPLRYRNTVVLLADGSEHTALVGQEKGVDIRIALDVVRAVHENDCDVVLLFSQDQDFREVADEVRAIAKQQDRWVKIASAFPQSPTYDNHRGIEKTDWLPFDRKTYNSCLDRKDYRPKTK